VIGWPRPSIDQRNSALATASSIDAAFIHKTLMMWAVGSAAIVLGERIGVDSRR
jgi:hypothetical protein